MLALPEGNRQHTPVGVVLAVARSSVVLRLGVPPSHLEGLLKHKLPNSIPTVSEGINLKGAWEFGFLTNSQVMLILLI